MALETEMPSWKWQLRSWEDIKNTSLFTKANYINIACIIIFLYMAIRQVRSKKAEADKSGARKRYLQAPDFPTINEQNNFDHTKTEPIKIRNFKPNYFLTMAIENLNPDELLLVDKNYDDRIQYRRKILKEHYSNVCAVKDEARIGPAVRELYTFLLGTYLPLRYPTMFKLYEHGYETGKMFMLENRTTREVYPAAPINSQTSTTMLLETLGKNLDEDFLFLLPEDSEKEDSRYVLYAYMCVCPSGWNPSEKIGKRLAAIHEPVPGYSSKLESSMDRFFSKIEVGKYVKRSNWSITVDSELYAAGSDTNHAHEGDELGELASIDPETTVLRCERQTLHRLPKSRAVVFAFKTYLYSLKEIKEEGMGKELADAVDGLKSGNTPAMHFYKRGAVWGEAVKRYLRS